MVLSCQCSPKKSGIKINEMGFIKVDEYMRTDNSDIFAVGTVLKKEISSPGN